MLKRASTKSLRDNGRLVKYVKHKFNAQQTVNDGIKFASKKEASYYNYLKQLVSTKEVVFFLRQVPFHLTANIKYICDFQVFYSNGTVEFIDVKGYQTPEFKIKHKQVESLYPVKIKLV